MPPANPHAPRISLLTYGSRGDVEPFLALGVGLQQQGYAVRLAAPASFAPLIASYPLEFVPIEGDPDELAQAFADRAGLSWWRMIREMTQHVLPLAQRAFTAVLQATEDADLIVHSFLMTDAGHSLAQQKGIPDLSAQLFPVFLPTRCFPAVGFPPLPFQSGWLNWSMHTLNTAMFRDGARLLYRRIWKSLPESPRKGQLRHLAAWPFPSRSGFQTPILFAYSPNLLPKPADWPDYAHVTGYWQLPLSPGWQPPAPVARFLQDGPSPVYFGPGSMRTDRLQELLHMMIGALRHNGQRIFLGMPPELVPPALAGPDLYAASGLPHAWLFPQMRFILHHGGAGTTGAALTAGVPNSALPFSADQSFWQQQLVQRGLGPAFPSAHKASRPRLEQAFHQALHDPSYAGCAARLGAQVRQEHGVQAAVQIIQRIIGDQSSSGQTVPQMDSASMAGEWIEDRERDQDHHK